MSCKRRKRRTALVAQRGERKSLTGLHFMKPKKKKFKKGVIFMWDSNGKILVVKNGKVVGAQG